MLDIAELVDTNLYGAGSYRTPPPPDTPASSPHEVSFSVTNSWPGNFSGSVTIRNREPTPISGWTLEFDMAATITAGNLWGAEIESFSGTRYRLRNAAWTAAIAPAGTVTFTFNAGGLATAQMTNKVLNGLPVA